MQRDEQIFELIQAEKERQIDGIELIASENFVSNQVMEAAGLAGATFEQIIIDHPDEFSPRAVWYARKRFGLPNETVEIKNGKIIDRIL